MIDETDILVSADRLTRHYGGQRLPFSSVGHPLRAVDEVSFAIRRGETFGLVGESGCGKTTTGRLLAGLDRPTTGTIHFEGEDVTRLLPARWRLKRRDIQVVFQNPQSALDPQMTVRQQIREPLDLHAIGDRAGRDAVVDELMASVALSQELGSRYPHQISGGQAQRVVIARALSLRPQLIVCDEPVSALDVSVQSRVMALLMELQQKFDLAYLFISHDLRVVKKLSHRVAVMYLGEIVEEGATDGLYDEPLHPYTAALIAAIPKAMPGDRSDRARLGGDPPSPVNPPSGCRFHTRCPFVQDRCRIEHPELRQITPDHKARCHYAEDFQRARQ